MQDQAAKALERYRQPNSEFARALARQESYREQILKTLERFEAPGSDFARALARQESYREQILKSLEKSQSPNLGIAKALARQQSIQRQLAQVLEGHRTSRADVGDFPSSFETPTRGHSDTPERSHSAPSDSTTSPEKPAKSESVEARPDESQFWFIGLSLDAKFNYLVLTAYAGLSAYLLASSFSTLSGTEIGLNILEIWIVFDQARKISADREPPVQ